MELRKDGARDARRIQAVRDPALLEAPLLRGPDPQSSIGKAWREAADKFHDGATKLAAERRADIDAAVKQMKADASEAEARLQKLKQAGSESWTALSAALAESRKAFDRANQAAWDAFKRAAPPTT